ncbi:MAG: hypothetical protein A2802_01940 [Candidatus Woykebacteria bacterium RIFCSPHIGHO2_01_FULL_43_29]|uniref:MIP18 family-like domain-containing protein n=1 Tax=Candidatus Woykebacteria bacterium RIFCSPLOWO2_01_FULL_43_14 TaxID=1802605 RepID=A0A1G1WVT7_9BACT|nr:MAG: hypothetical protein A2802_01940 [Candidatus Woykebacteria bacterium RIFCSPHIGHO2_01_FULL_43_29]OGY31876.1 MAG: hypothetical protein A3A61_03115 [Candidatus Woykebacteria bacterium RIFCSPLOWO2_01_FULL_43_14]
MTTAVTDTHVQRAISELQAVITERYPTATFDVTAGEDEPTAIHLRTTVDLDDPDEVLDLVIDRVLAFQVEQGIPVHVIPLRTPKRLAQLLKQTSAQQTPAALIGVDVQ